jgi:hypothetical protein
MGPALLFDPAVVVDRGEQGRDRRAEFLGQIVGEDLDRDPLSAP